MSETLSAAVAAESWGGRPCPILVNDKAGALKSTPGPDEIEELARELEIPVEVIPSGSPDDARAILRRLVAEGAERVAVAGGDGTVAMAVQILACTDTALGILPQGTANNFATALRLPMDLPSALRILHEGIVRPVDLGQVGDDRLYFTESAGVGLFADALTLYGAKANKNALRTLYAMLRLLMSLRARRIRLTVDGEVHTERAVMCEAANSFRMAHAVPIAPGAKLTDGELDVVIVGDLTRGELLPYYRAFRAQLHQTLPKVHIVRAKEVKIESRAPFNVHCDDKRVGLTPVTLRAAPRALKVLVERL
jgi:diacylglycerol kinase (ATP)